MGVTKSSTRSHQVFEGLKMLPAGVIRGDCCYLSPAKTGGDMSKEQAEKFFDQLEKDKALQGQDKAGTRGAYEGKCDYDATEED